MKCIMVIKTSNGDYRIYWDLKHKDWFILTPSFRCSRHIGHVGLNEHKDKIEKAIERCSKEG